MVQVLGIRCVSQCGSFRVGAQVAERMLAEGDWLLTLRPALSEEGLVVFLDMEIDDHDMWSEMIDLVTD